jgi:hypothetical protein
MPQGSVGLCQQIRDIAETIAAIAPSLAQQGRKVCVLVTTDGDSSDGDLISALRPLQDLPVWLVVMLFTANPEVLAFWDNIDRQLSLDMDVISDIMTEAKQVQETNPWLTYGVPLHQMRLLGASVKELDLLDERPLNITQMERILKLALPEDCFSKITQKAGENFAGFVDEVDCYMKVHIKYSLPSSPSYTPITTPRGSSILPLPISSPTMKSNVASPTGIASQSGSRKSMSGAVSPLSSPMNDFDMLLVWDPISMMMKPWIDVSKLAESFELTRTPKSASCVIS